MNNDQKRSFQRMNMTSSVIKNNLKTIHFFIYL
jgi:hypothetical protein